VPRQEGDAWQCHEPCSGKQMAAGHGQPLTWAGDSAFSSSKSLWTPSRICMHISRCQKVTGSRYLGKAAINQHLVLCILHFWMGSCVLTCPSGLGRTSMSQWVQAVVPQLGALKQTQLIRDNFPGTLVHTFTRRGHNAAKKWSTYTLLLFYSGCFP